MYIQGKLILSSIGMARGGSRRGGRRGGTRGGRRGGTTLEEFKNMTPAQIAMLPLDERTALEAKVLAEGAAAAATQVSDNTKTAPKDEPSMFSNLIPSTPSITGITGIFSSAAAKTAPAEAAAAEAAASDPARGGRRSRRRKSRARKSRLRKRR